MRNGRIGQLKTVQVGLPGDPPGGPDGGDAGPQDLNYEAWLGSTPHVYYTEDRVHPQVGYDRPGWLRCEQFGAGMITGWGAHHVDSAHWGMGTEHTGPVEMWGAAEFPKTGLWNVHGPFRTEAIYADGVRMIISGDFPNGVRFEGTDGWIFVSRGNEQGHRPAIPARSCGPAGPRGQRPEDPDLGDRARTRSISTRARSTTATGSSACARGSSRWRPSRSRIAPARPACSTTSR